VFHISIWGDWSFVCGTKPTKAPVAPGLSWAPHLFDCKPRLIHFFSSFHAAYNQERLTFFLLYRIV